MAIYEPIIGIPPTPIGSVGGSSGSQVFQFQNLTDANAFLANVRAGTASVPDGFEISVLNEPCGRSVTLGAPLSASHIRQCVRGSLTWTVGLDTSVVHELAVMPTTQGVDGDTAVVLGATVWRRGVIDGQGTANTWTVVGSVQNYGVNGEIRFNAEYGPFQPGDEIGAALNAASIRAAAENKKLKVDCPPKCNFTGKWSIPLGCAVEGVGDDGYLWIYFSENTGKRWIELESGEFHWVTGIRAIGGTFAGGVSTRNAIGFSAGKFVPLWQPSTPVTLTQATGDNTLLQASGNIYQVVTAGTTGTTEPTGTGAGIADGTAVLNFVGTAANYTATIEVSRSYFNIITNNVSTGFESCGWENTGTVWCRHISDTGAIMHQQNNNRIQFFFEAVNKPFVIHTSFGLNVDNISIQGTAITASGEIDGCVGVVADVAYLEVSPTVTVPLVKVGFKKQCSSVDIDNITAYGLQNQIPYIQFDDVICGRARGKITSPGGAASSILATKTAKSQMVDIVAAQIDGAALQDRLVNLWPNPDCQNLAFPRWVVGGGQGVRATASMDTTTPNTGLGCLNVAAVSGQTACYIEAVITDTYILNRLAGGNATLAFDVLPSGTLNAKTTKVELAYDFNNANTFVVGSAFEALCGDWNIFGRVIPVPVGCTQLNVRVYASVGAAGASDSVKIRKAWLVPGSRLADIKYRPDSILDGYPHFTTGPNGQSVIVADTLDTSAGSVQSFAVGDRRRYRSAQGSGAINALVTVPGNVNIANFVDEFPAIEINGIGATAATGVTTEVINQTVQIPADWLLLRGLIRGNAFWNTTANTNTKTVRIYLNSAANLTGATLLYEGVANTALNNGVHIPFGLRANNSRTAQLVDIGGFLPAAATTNVRTAAFNSANAMFLLFTSQLAVGTDSSALASFNVRMSRG